MFELDQKTIVTLNGQEKPSNNMSEEIEYKETFETTGTDEATCPADKVPFKRRIQNNRTYLVIGCVVILAASAVTLGILAKNMVNKNKATALNAAITFLPTMSSFPSLQPSESPSRVPSSPPSERPSSVPSEAPSTSPSVIPTTSPSISPSTAPSTSPSAYPSSQPSSQPSASPTSTPTTSQPTEEPSSSPTKEPTEEPTKEPTRTPTTEVPTSAPTIGYVDQNPVPNNPPNGYFNYDTNDNRYGPRRWGNVDTSNHWLKEFTNEGWGPYQGHLHSKEPLLNKCDYPDRRQSPKNLVNSGGLECDMHHEIRTRVSLYCRSALFVV